VRGGTSERNIFSRCWSPFQPSAIFFLVDLKIRCGSSLFADFALGLWCSDDSVVGDLEAICSPTEEEAVPLEGIAGCDALVGVVGDGRGGGDGGEA
jgi:hypothetical protein